MEIKTEQFTELAKKELKNDRSRLFLKLIPPVMKAKREAGLGSLPDAPAAMACGAAIRAEAISRLPELLEEFEKKATANGMKVVWTRDDKEANEFIKNLAKEKGIKYVTKGKSMVTEETALNELLAYKPGWQYFDADTGALGLYGFMEGQELTPGVADLDPAVVQEVRDILAQMLAGEFTRFDVFTGPINDNKGNVVLPEGQSLQQVDLEAFPEYGLPCSVPVCKKWWAEGITAELPQ